MWVCRKILDMEVNPIILATPTPPPPLCPDIPALPPPKLEQEDPGPLDQDQDQDTDEWNKPSTPNKFKKLSGPRTLNPYSSDESWFMPITVAIAVFLPILFCMCRIR